MSLSINMNSGASAGGGVGIGLMTSAGNPWSVPDALAIELVNRGLATAYNWPAVQAPVLNSYQIAAPSSQYKFMFPGRQYVGSGHARDVSGNGAEATINSAYTDAAAWANPGYITIGAGTSLNLLVDKSLVQFALSAQSILFSLRMNKAAPAGTEYLCGCGQGASQGFYISVLSTGKVQVSVVTSIGLQGMGTPSSAVFADGTDHVLTFLLDSLSKRLILYIDGVISDVLQSAFSGSTTVIQNLALGAINGAFTTTYAAKLSGIHMMAWPGGLPLNINAIVGLMAQSPHLPVPASMLPTFTGTRILETVFGQSNELGNGPTKSQNLSIGVPLKDVSNRSAWPLLAELAGRRGVWLDTHNQARGGTSIVDSWVGVIKAWVSGLNVAKGTYLLSSGGIWKCNVASTGVSTTQPTGTADTTGADAIPWLYLGVPGIADVAGVLASTHARFDPNGYVAAAVGGLNAAVGFTTKVAIISFGQTDYTLQNSRALFAAAYRSITDYCLSLGAKVGIGFTCYYPAGEAYFQSTLIPGMQDALASYAGNPNVFAGANWRAALGVLATNPASGPGLQADATHMNDAAYTLASAAWANAYIAAGLI